MNDARKADSRALEWSFRFGIPMLAWAVVLAFFAFAGSIPSNEPVVATAGRVNVPLGAGASATGSSLGHELPRQGEPKTGEPVVTNLDLHQRVTAGAQATR